MIRILNGENNIKEYYFIFNNFPKDCVNLQFILGVTATNCFFNNRFSSPKKFFTYSSRFNSNSDILPWSWDNLNKLDNNKLYCISSDLTSIVYIFDSYVEAARTLTPLKCANFSDIELKVYKNIRHIHRNINTTSLTKTELGSFYLVEHPETLLRKKRTNKKIVYVLNLITGQILNFESYNVCVQWFQNNGFKLSITHLSILVNKTIIKKKQLTYVFDGKFLFSSKNDFVDWVNLDKYPEALYLLSDKKSETNKIDNIDKVIPHLKLYEHPVNQRNIIQKENRKHSGVYAWFNKLNSKIYVGSGVLLYKRLRSYFSNAYLNQTENMLISKALKKYGMVNFKLYILEHTNTDNVIEREQYWIDVLKPEYNINPKASGTLGFTHTLSSKLKMRNKALGRLVSEETKKKMSLARLGYKFSDDVLEKLKGRVFTAEHKAKISKALIGRGYTEERLKNHIVQVTKLKGIKLIVTDVQTGNIENFDSITLAANKLRASRSAIQNCMSKNTLFRKKYKISRDCSN